VREGWSRKVYEQSVSSGCWWYTPYDAGWDGCAEFGADMSSDEELRDIVRMEVKLGCVPHWARQIVERSINFLPPCGHYLFPQPYLEVVSAIGSETASAFIHGCFTVGKERKQRMMDYVFCLDAWLAGSGPGAPARELAALGHQGVDWQAVCAELWKVLGDHTELKDLLVERLIHSQRWKLKERVSDEDGAWAFGRDQYLGDYSETGNPASQYGYVGRAAPAFDEARSPRIRKLESRLAEICPDWEWFGYTIRYGWLCAPKAFRYLERLLWSVGQEKRVIHTHDHPMGTGEKVPRFLQCEDTYPDPREATQWWTSFSEALKAWWPEKSGHEDKGSEVASRLGEPTAVKRWLVRLLVRKLEFRDQRHIVSGRLACCSSAKRNGGAGSE